MRRLVAVTAVCAATLTLSSCVDSRTDPPPPPVKVTAAEIAGTWHGWQGSSLTLGAGAKAAAVRLDGQEFDFDDGWRMTGTGTWTLLKPGAYRGGNFVGNGSVIHLEITPTKPPEAPATPTSSPSTPSPSTPSPSIPSPSIPSPSPNPTVAASRTAPPPDKAVWDIGVTKGKKNELLLVFLTSDPDIRDTYYLTKNPGAS